MAALVNDSMVHKQNDAAKYNTVWACSRLYSYTVTVRGALQLLPGLCLLCCAGCNGFLCTFFCCQVRDTRLGIVIPFRVQQARKVPAVWHQSSYIGAASKETGC